MDELKKELKNLIARNKVKQALQKMADLPEDKKVGQSADIFGLQARLKEHTRNSNMGTIDPMTAGVQKAQIVQGVLALIDGLGEEPVAAPEPVATPSAPPTPAIKTILFLAANPENTGKLRLGAEYRKIDEFLQQSNNRDEFNLEVSFATTTQTLKNNLHRFSPKIVHFSGHGVRQENDGEVQEGGEENRSFMTTAIVAETEALSYSGGIILEDEQGKPRMVEDKKLANLLKAMKGIELVFLNACYSESQAKAFLEVVPYVIGMNTAVPDATAIEFAAEFYLSLGSDKDYKESFDAALASIDMENIQGTDIPVFKSNQSLIQA